VQARTWHERRGEEWKALGVIMVEVAEKQNSFHGFALDACAAH
jgi:hypothetical protein